MRTKSDHTDLAFRQKPGFSKDEAPEWNGQVFWVVRGTRPEGTAAVTRLSRRITKWTGEEDQMLLHFLGYLKAYPDLGITLTVCLRDIPTLEQKTWSDADLMGDPEETKSTIGCNCAMQ